MKINDNRFGNKNIIPETIIQIIAVMINPDDTIEPIDFLSFLPE